MIPTAAERNRPRWRSEDPLPGWIGAICLAGLAFFLRRWHLGTPHQFSFDVRGPLVLTGSPAYRHKHPLYLGTQPTFELVVASPVEPARAQPCSTACANACSLRSNARTS